MAVIDLNVNRDLLDYKFEGYKLSLDPIPILKQPINGGVERFTPCSDEYSYLQVHMSSHFNQLFQDSWSPSCIFFISQKFICCCSLMQDRHLSPLHKVWKFPTDVPLKGNSAIAFPATEWAVVSNGSGIIFILHTPSRPVGEPWILCHTYTVPDCVSSCYLLDSVHMSLPSRQQVECLVAHFCKASDSEESAKSPPFNCHLEWLSFSCGQNMEDWSLKRTRRLSGSTPLLYVALEKSCDAVYVASENEFQFVYDSEKPFLTKQEQLEESAEKVPPLYTYIQTPEDITVVFRLEQKAKKSDIQVNFKSHHIEIIWRGESVLKGQLPNAIDCTCSTWVVSEERLELILCKAEVGLMWQELVMGDKRGEELMDPALVEQIHSQLAHLTSESEVTPGFNKPFTMSQLEECDCNTDTLVFLRIDGNSHKPTHQVNMGGHQWLFSSQLGPKSLPVLCLRHDVDGVVWQPRNASSDGELDQFKIDHIATFSALGYVQASKQDKKFATCSLDFNYSVISDCTRHVYIYCRPESLHSALELRNRRTGECVSHVAKQYVMSLENCYEILGLQVSNECIFVLSSNMLYAIKMCAK